MKFVSLKLRNFSPKNSKVTSGKNLYEQNLFRYFLHQPRTLWQILTFEFILHSLSIPFSWAHTFPPIRLHFYIHAYLLFPYFLDVIVNILNCGEFLTYKPCGDILLGIWYSWILYAYKIFSIINLLHRVNSRLQWLLKKKKRN